MINDQSSQQSFLGTLLNNVPSKLYQCPKKISKKKGLNNYEQLKIKVIDRRILDWSLNFILTINIISFHYL